MPGDEYSVLTDSKYGGYSAAQQSVDAEEDPSFSAQLPYHLKTERQKWTSFFVITSMCAIASGPVAAWPTLEPVLTDVGLFKGMGQEALFGSVYSLSVAALLGTSLPAGWLYDRYGGRFCCFWGAMGASAGLLLMSLSVFWPTELWWCMFAGYPMAMVGGQINSFGIFVFIWILPDHQNFVSSASSAVTSLSDMLALVAVGLSDCCGFFIGYFFMVLALMAAIAGMVCWIYIPGHRVMLEVAGSVIHGDAAAIVSAAEEDHVCCGPEMKLLRESWRVMRKHAAANGLLLAFSTAYFLSVLYPTQEMLYYYQSLFPSPVATELVNIYAVVYGIGGFFCAISGGALCDKVGLRVFTAIVVGCCVFVFTSLSIPLFSAQIAGQLGLTLSFSLYSIVVNRFSMLYASPDLFGTLGGLQFTIISGGMLVGMQLLSLLNQELAGDSKAAKYQAVFVVTGLVATVLGTALIWYWGRVPPPAVGDVSAETAEPDEDVI